MHFRAADSLSLPSAPTFDANVGLANGTLAGQDPDVQAAVGTLMGAVTRSVKSQADLLPAASPMPSQSTPFQALPPIDFAPPSPAALPRTPAQPAPPAPGCSGPARPPGSPECPQPAAAARKNSNDPALHAWRSQTQSQLHFPDGIRAEPGRSAAEIINANPVFKHLGQQKDLHIGALKQRLGDWEKEPDPQRRADAAERMSRLLTYVKSVPDREGGSRGAIHTSRELVGLTHNGRVREGTEAALLKTFALSGHLGDALAPTNDRYVRKDGSTRSNADVAFRDMTGGLSRVVSGVLGAVTALVGSLAGMVPGLGKLAGALIEATAGTVSNYASAGADILGENLSDAEKKRKLDEAARESAAQVTSSAVGIVDPTGIAADLASGAVEQAVHEGTEKKAMKKAQECAAGIKQN